MIHTRDHQTPYLFDPWENLGPKRRKLLTESWADVFHKHILRELPVDKIAPHFTEGFGRPTKELYAVLGSLILQQMHDLTDEETVDQFCFNIKWHYALDIPGESDGAKYMCLKTLWTLRHLVMREGLDVELFNRTTELLAEAFRVDTSRQRIDSVHIRSNMKRLGRIGIFSRSIHVFLINLKRQRPEIFETIDKELVDRYLTQKALGCFSLVKPSEAGKTLERVARDLFSLVRRFREEREVNSLHSYNTMARVLKEQCRVSEKQDDQPAEVEVKAPKEISCASLQNPSDPDAGYSGHKGQGYHAQMMETYCNSEDEQIKESTLNLITHVEVEPAHVSDVHALLPALESTKERGLAPEFKEKYRWRSGIESTFSGMDKQTGIKHLRVRGLNAVGYCARLKAIGVNLFRAARVKRVLDALRPLPGAVSAVICSIVGDVKEHFVSPWRRLSDIFKSAIENMLYTVRIAA